MNETFAGWPEVCSEIRARAKGGPLEPGQLHRLEPGQRESLWALADRLEGGAGNVGRCAIVADDVGMGKTRVATAVAASVKAAGGRVAIVIPAGLRYQWQEELRGDGISPPPFLHTLDGYLRRGGRPKKGKAKAVAPSPDPAESQIVLVSHGFANFQFQTSDGNAGAGRWGFLPALVAEHASVHRTPWGYPAVRSKILGGVALAKTTLARLHHDKDVAALAELTSWASEEGWRRRYWDARADYTRSQGGLGERFDQALGYCFGRFDMVIIDEAHKSRDGEEAVGAHKAGRAESALTRVLEHVLNLSPDAARIALTATPMALAPEQWLGTLARIKVPEAERRAIRADVERFTKCSRELHGRWRSSPAHRAAWLAAAAQFQKALTPYVVRRDKSEVPAIKNFRARSMGVDYRRFRPELLQAQDVPRAWQRVVLAAEGLSAAVSGTTDALAKRLRTTLANGNGLSALIEETLRPPKPSEIVDDTAASGASDPDPKRAQRAALWRRVIAQQVGLAGDPLYGHPLILRAVDLIEAELRRGQKILVFGRFIAGMVALHDLLNARAKMRSLLQPDAALWPAEYLCFGEVDRRGEPRPLSAADKAAATQYQMDLSTLPARADAHRARWRDDVRQRRWWREHVVEILEKALEACGKPGDEKHPSRERQILHAIADDVTGRAAEATSATPAARESDPVREASPLDEAAGDSGIESAPVQPPELHDESKSATALLARATRELMTEDERQLLLEERNSERLAAAALAAYRELLAAVDQDRSTDDAEERVTDAGWGSVKAYIEEAFSPGKTGLARLLRGDTKMPTRRLLQAAFNRERSFPSVLIAQSVVGREGLNLHKACRIILQFHPEWNPGVEEQQIGRVDRYGSRWQQEFEALPPDAVPEDTRIEVRSIIFGGTYDEHHWGVLVARRRELRAQLHGEIILLEECEGDPALLEIARELNAAAPRFHPPHVPELTRGG